jgi:hypothetical protein
MMVRRSVQALFKPTTLEQLLKDDQTGKGESFPVDNQEYPPPDTAG